MVGRTDPRHAPPGFTVPPASGSSTSPGAVPADPRAPATLPKDSPAAAVNTKKKDDALDTAPTAQPEADKRWTVKSVLAVTVVGLWLLFGLIGFVMSLICFGYSGSAGEKILGILISLALGPFYFLYYFSSGSYCKAMPPTLF
jgi:hypothetical protein